MDAPLPIHEELAREAPPPPQLHDCEFAPGIYFGISDDDYHAANALSTSGIKNLLISPMDYWARCPWFNADAEARETDAMDLGKAYHARILEGRDKFARHFAPELDPALYPDALRTNDEIKARILELDPGAKKGGNKAELIDRLIALDPRAQIWDVLLQGHMAGHEGKTFISASELRRLEIAAAMIEKHPELSKAFTGGYPEVSIFWIDEATGVPMKCRTDYLKTKAIVDLKTFANQRGKEIDKAVAYAMAERKYHIQVAVYMEGVRAAKEMLLRDGPNAAHGDVDIEWLERFAGAAECRFLFVFQQTGIAPVARGYEFPRHLTFDCGQIAVRSAREKYAQCYRTFGADPWIDAEPIRAFDDTEFPVFMTE